MSETSSSHSPASPSAPHAAGTYRAFFVARNGRVIGMVPLQAASEEEACLLARGLAEGDDVVELWADLRTVARFERCNGCGLHS